mgnify:CR=1 FL=1
MTDTARRRTCANCHRLIVASLNGLLDPHWGYDPPRRCQTSETFEQVGDASGSPMVATVAPRQYAEGPAWNEPCRSE